MEEKSEFKPVNLGDTGEVEMETLDVTPYIGRRVKIASVSEMEGKFGFSVKIVTQVIDKVKLNGKDVDITASKILGLQQGKDQKIGWAKNSNLGAFLDKHKVKHYRELVGKEVIVQSQMKKDSKKEYLTF